MFKKIFLLFILLVGYSYGFEQRFNVDFDIHSFVCNNADLRNIDETSYKTVQYTDDFFYLMYANLYLKYLFKNEFLSLYTKISRPFFFGNDEAAKSYQSFIIENLYADITIINNLKLKAGRYKFKTFEDESIPDYVYSDTIDSISINYSIFDFIKITALVDFFALNSPDYAYDVKINRENSIQYFNGDVNIIKSGGLINFGTRFDSEWIRLLSISPYFFYASIGAVNSEQNKTGGNEKTLKGTLGNFSDGDYLMVGGLNSYINSQYYKLGLQIAYSYGKDIKDPYTPDVTISGILLSGLLRLMWDIFYCEIVSIYSEGGKVDKNGNWQNYGFISMKGERVGGYIFKDIYGIYPSGIIDYDGINFLPFERSRRAATISLKTEVGITNLKLLNFETNTLFLNLYVDSWFHWDNNLSEIDFSNLNTTTLEHFKRLQKFMGIENDIKISIELNQQFELGIFGGIFWSYDFFWKYPTTSDVPLGTDLSWTCGSELKIKI
ncbi:MAG: hypothetical protein N2258_05010 [Brevinematales bacterium]|nr:hypothetical protein [Brevinematales bacterium]